MKDIMISIRPHRVELISNGTITVEIRKTKPRLVVPFKCYIYCSGKVVGEFVCDKITRFESEFWDDNTFERIQEIYPSEDVSVDDAYIATTVAANDWDNYKENWLCKDSCVSWEELRIYVGRGIKTFYGWHISDLKFYDEPKGLWKFFKPCDGCDKIGTIRCTEESSPCRAKVLTQPPMSWCYVKGKN